MNFSCRGILATRVASYNASCTVAAGCTPSRRSEWHSVFNLRMDDTVVQQEVGKAWTFTPQVHSGLWTLGVVTPGLASHSHPPARVQIRCKIHGRNISDVEAKAPRRCRAPEAGPSWCLPILISWRASSSPSAMPGPFGCRRRPGKVSLDKSRAATQRFCESDIAAPGLKVPRRLPALLLPNAPDAAKVQKVVHTVSPPAYTRDTIHNEHSV